MPFSWYHADVPNALRVRPERTLEMYLLEIRERAALLRRLGYNRDQTLSRVKGNVRWDFELHTAPVPLTQITKVVEAVFAGQSLGGGGTPSLEA